MLPINIQITDSEILEIFNIIEGVGEHVKMCGGAVRDILLYREPKDFDFCTTLLPEKTMDLFKERGWYVYPTGLDHGTVSVRKTIRLFEITTLRRDVETDGRKAKVAFTKSFFEDAQRRDFTINALLMNRDGSITDHVDGLEDLKNRRIRFVGDADQRVAEDYLRILRFYRFRAQLNFKLPFITTQFSMGKKVVEGFKSLSRERVWDEFKKILACAGCASVVRTMHRRGLLELIIPSLSNTKFSCLDFTSDVHIKLALLHDKDHDLQRELKLSNSDLTHVNKLIEMENSNLSYPELWFTYDEEDYIKFVDYLRCKKKLRSDRKIQDAASFVGRDKPILPVDGNDMKMLGKVGPSVGFALREAAELFIASDFTLDRKTMMEMLNCKIT